MYLIVKGILKSTETTFRGAWGGTGATFRDSGSSDPVSEAQCSRFAELRGHQGDAMTRRMSKVWRKTRGCACALLADWPLVG